jgi:Ca-activated chloride channel family protein
LEAAKDEAINFISGRPNDRIAVVAFAGETFTQCPLTTDHAAVINLLSQLKTGLIEDGTAIGLGLANAVARLKDDNAKSKIIILLTDGVNNKGEIAPITAAEIAKTLGIRVYTIGVGKNGTAPYPVQTDVGILMQQVEVEIDEKLLQEISSLTGGQYFRATNGEKLSEIYIQIDKLEKTIFEKDDEVQYKDYFLPFIIFALIFLLIEIILSNTIFKTIP